MLGREVGKNSTLPLVSFETLILQDYILASFVLERQQFRKLSHALSSLYTSIQRTSPESDGWGIYMLSYIYSIT